MEHFKEKLTSLTTCVGRPGIPRRIHALMLDHLPPWETWRKTSVFLCEQFWDSQIVKHYRVGTSNKFCNKENLTKGLSVLFALTDHDSFWVKVEFFFCSSHLVPEVTQQCFCDLLTSDVLSPLSSCTFLDHRQEACCVVSFLFTQHWVQWHMGQAFGSAALELPLLYFSESLCWASIPWQ